MSRCEHGRVAASRAPQGLGPGAIDVQTWDIGHGPWTALARARRGGRTDSGEFGQREHTGSSRERGKTVKESIGERAFNP